jgi:lipoate---protein ligase
LSAGDWAVSTFRGPAAALHGRELPAHPGRQVWVLEPSRPALVVGSTQSDAVADAAVLGERGIDLVRRRSGGGAVLLDPVRTLWVDVLLGRGDPLWHDDVSAAFGWLGRVWCTALRQLGLPATVPAVVARPTAQSRLVCFAGVGAGEVEVAGRKAVGLSQRRTRSAARFQCVAYRGTGSAAGIVDLLAAPSGAVERAALRAHLDRSTTALDVDRTALLDAVVAALPPLDA